jgi:hypothetical protein
VAYDTKNIINTALPDIIVFNNYTNINYSVNNDNAGNIVFEGILADYCVCENMTFLFIFLFFLQPTHPSTIF